MQKSSLPVSLKTLVKYHEKDGTLKFDCPIQRASGQWNNYAMSLLIHSMLSDYIIPNIYFRKETEDGKNMLSVIDGKQRLTACMGFINDEWTTHAKTPEALIDGVSHDIALKKFSELDEEVKQAILAHRFTIFQLEDCTDEELEEIFSRINNGTPLSKIQTARPVLGMELAEFFNGLCGHPFFQASLKLTPAQLRREDDFLTLMTVAMLVEDLYFEDFKIKTVSSAAECVRFAEVIRDDYSSEKRELMEGIVEYLDSAFGDGEKKYLKKTNAVVVGYLAAVMLENKIGAGEYAEAVTRFFEGDETEAYKEASGSGNVKMVNVNIRIKELLNYLKSWYPERLGEPEKPEVPEVQEETEEKFSPESEGEPVLEEEAGAGSEEYQGEGSNMETGVEEEPAVEPEGKPLGSGEGQDSVAEEEPSESGEYPESEGDMEEEPAVEPEDESDAGSGMEMEEEALGFGEEGMEVPDGGQD